MILLDLPPEVFDRIVMHLTTEVGIEETWKKYRNVCRTFRHSIEYEVLVKPPYKDASKRRTVRSILGGYQGLYLCYRVRKSEKGRLPEVLRKLFEAACSGLPDHDEQTRQKSARILCEVITTHLDGWRNPWIDDDKLCDDTPPWIHNCDARHLERTDFSAAVVVAAAFGNLQGVRAALEDNEYDIWDGTDSWYFGSLDSPLEGAAAGGHFELVRTILKCFEQNYRRMAHLKWVPQFRKAITRSLQYRHASTALLLLRVYDAYGPPLRSNLPDLKKWNELAMQTRNIEVITQMKNMRWDYTNNPFRDACACNDLAAVRMFVEEGLVSLHSISCEDEPLTPIEEAVESRSVKSVQLLLEMGADPAAGNEDYPTLLLRAAEYVDTDMIRVLLQYGAGGLIYISIGESLDRLDERRAIQSMLKEAHDRGQFFVRSADPRTDLTIDAEDLFV